MTISEPPRPQRRTEPLCPVDVINWKQSERSRFGLPSLSRLPGSSRTRASGLGTINVSCFVPNNVFRAAKSTLITCLPPVTNWKSIAKKHEKPSETKIAKNTSYGHVPSHITRNVRSSPVGCPTLYLQSQTFLQKNFRFKSGRIPFQNAQGGWNPITGMPSRCRSKGIGVCPGRADASKVR